jgi:aspartate racemase
MPHPSDPSDNGGDALEQRLSALSSRRRAALDALLGAETGSLTPDRARENEQLLARRIADLSPKGREALRRHRREASSRTPELRRRLPGTRVPLAFAQERLWVLDQFLPGNPAYNETNSMRLSFAVDLGALRRAVNEIVRRHEVLRTTVEVIDDRPYQRVESLPAIEIPCIVLEHLAPADREPEALRLAAEQSQASFDLAAGPLVRASVFRLAPDDHFFVLTMHHLVCDGWSMGVFMVEFVTLYWSFIAGKPSPLPELPVQYGDYAIWQRELISPSVLDEHMAYWRTQLADPPTLQVPTDRPRPAEFTFRGARCAVEIRGDTHASLSTLAHQEGATMFMVLLAAFVVLLHRYTEQEDVVVGTASAGRPRRELEPLIGFFVNSLVLRVRVADDATFLDVLDEVKRTVIDAYAHQDVPFNRLVEELQPHRDKSRNPLFQVMFQLFSPPSAAGLRKDVLMPFQPVESGISKTDLALDLLSTEDAVQGHMEYNTDLFDRVRIERMVVHYGRLLDGIVADPAQRISRLDMLTEDERTRLVVEWNQTAVPYPSRRTIPQLFAEQVDRTPEAVALRFGDRTMTYRELRDRAAAVGEELVARGVQHGDVVGLYLDRGLAWPVAALGVLQAGAAYVPLDPSNPPERIRFLVDDCGAGTLLTTAESSAALAGFGAAVVVPPDGEVGPPVEDHTIGQRAAATDLAYVMYTSGTTGRPKGVAVTHRNIVRLVMNVSYAELGDSPTVLQFASVSFDASTFEVWGCLLHGGTLCIHPPGVPSLEELGAFIRREKITLLFLTTALFAQMIDTCPADLRGVGQVITGGEVLFAPIAREAWKALPRSRISNAYGPTECTTFACMYPIGRPDTFGDQVPIGRPIENTTAYVLDRHGNLMPVGVPGELCLGGDGVAAGYWTSPELTEERFVPDPFSGGGRLYRTGDVACFREDGQIMFLGRRDRQVKVSGFRVEPAEIEAAMRAHPEVRAAAVVSVGTEPKHLEAFYEGIDPGVPAVDDLRAHLLQRLPRYMVPTRLEPVDALPLTSNGKVDIDRLARRSSRDRGVQDGYVAPRTPVEQELAAMWSELLDVERVGVHDNFFDLGGHSLVATRLLSRVRATFEAEVTMRSFFDAPTVEDLARQLH